MTVSADAFRISALALGLLCTVAVYNASAQQSASYRMKRISAGPVAERVASPSFRSTVSVSTVVGTAGVCPSGPSTSTGVWSFLGTVRVPVVLYVDKNDLDPPDVELEWTGQADEFEVYRSDLPDGLITPANLLFTTSTCSATDTMAAGPDILFYSIAPAEPTPRFAPNQLGDRR